MSLVIGAKLDGVVMLAADCRVTDQSRILAPYRKIRPHGAWLVGSAGSISDDYLFFHGLDPGFDFSDPVQYADRVAHCADYWDRLNKIPAVEPLKYEVNFQCIAANGPMLIIGNPAGFLSAEEWYVIGWPQITQALFHREYSPTMTAEALEALATEAYDLTSRLTGGVGDGLDIVWTRRWGD